MQGVESFSETSSKHMQRGTEAVENSGSKSTSGTTFVSASDAAAVEFETMMDPEKVASLRKRQESILRELNDSRMTLKEFNNFSQQAYNSVANDFAKHTRLMKAMKTDLEYIFKHTRHLKDRIRSKYPDAFKDIPPERPGGVDDMES
mmetsp:Transcript_44454/g.85032  ORF Transcript_44454/g.85032 Transcript_44454/m.85032 type:complete len:147 (-) Transcript_44454:240-680(-)|eukprot:CAMPEP_0114227026 /NCGR_PEP_ID=MMETSP0058-20121206/1559_1 /TAXON_ID=36894 /ORGANISM="Pyramimonas parkeae, CCMP726" /LENGTH=146 /DNA_ID=CAMNT_0001337817 /DNA_START=119 /DNA_END=559 /DNA_ORIENTATION=+